MTSGIVIEKEMGITHAEFFRIISRVLGDYRQSETGVTAEDGARSLDISLAEEGERRIALMRMPKTSVTLTFRGYAAEEIADFLATFDRTFQRGGG